MQLRSWSWARCWQSPFALTTTTSSWPISPEWRFRTWRSPRASGSGSCERAVSAHGGNEGVEADVSTAQHDGDSAAFTGFGLPRQSGERHARRAFDHQMFLLGEQAHGGCDLLLTHRDSFVDD